MLDNSEKNVLNINWKLTERNTINYLAQITHGFGNSSETMGSQGLISWRMTKIFSEFELGERIFLEDFVEFGYWVNESDRQKVRHFLHCISLFDFLDKEVLYCVHVLGLNLSSLHSGRCGRMNAAVNYNMGYTKERYALAIRHFSLCVDGLLSFY